MKENGSELSQVSLSKSWKSSAQRQINEFQENQVKLLAEVNDRGALLSAPISTVVVKLVRPVGWLTANLAE